MDGFCKPRCEDCRYFRGDPDDDTSGFCHFNPLPTPIVNEHWCGRFRNIDGEKFPRWDQPEDVHSAKVDP